MGIRITDYLTPDLVKIPLASTDKTAAITELVDLLASRGKTRDRNGLLNAVLEREAQRTTGVGRGLAIPHAKTDVCPQLVMAFGRSDTPIDFASIDGKPVRLIPLLAGPPDQTGPHIHILARLGRITMNDTLLNDLLTAPNAQTFWEVLRRYDETA